MQAKVLKLLHLGPSLLFVTHDLALARKVSDRVGVLLKGELVECVPRILTSSKFLIGSAREGLKELSSDLSHLKSRRLLFDKMELLAKSINVRCCKGGN